MATRLREQIYTPLSFAEARALVKEANGLVDEAVDSEVDEESEDLDDGYGALDVFDEVSLVAQESLPSGPRGAPDALERFATCRSTLTLDYDGRVHDKQPFIALQKLLVARVGKAVVWRGEGGEQPPAKGAKLVTLEAFVSEREKEAGSQWGKTAPLGKSEEPVRKPLETRHAKPGEVDAASVHKWLVRLIQGNDPFARDALKKALEKTTEPVRAYAAALMENGPVSDGEIAKELETTPSIVAASREALGAILKAIR